jgi:hypothetical protein
VGVLMCTFISGCLGLKSFLLYKVKYGIRSQKFICALCHAIGRHWSAKIDDISLGPPVSIGSQKPSWHYIYFRYEYNKFVIYFTMKYHLQ